jgi:hypothetical protein
VRATVNTVALGRLTPEALEMAKGIRSAWKLAVESVRSGKAKGVEEVVIGPYSARLNWGPSRKYPNQTFYFLRLPDVFRVAHDVIVASAVFRITNQNASTDGATLSFTCAECVIDNPVVEL